jgi:hypothetical protein
MTASEQMSFSVRFGTAKSQRRVKTLSLQATPEERPSRTCELPSTFIQWPLCGGQDEEMNFCVGRLVTNPDHELSANTSVATNTAPRAGTFTHQLVRVCCIQSNTEGHSPMQRTTRIRGLQRYSCSSRATGGSCRELCGRSGRPKTREKTGQKIGQKSSEAEKSIFKIVCYIYGTW